MSIYMKDTIELNLKLCYINSTKWNLSYSADKLIMSFSVISRNTLQGLPTAITPAGISLFTTLPAPIMLPHSVYKP